MNSERISAAARKYLERIKSLPCGVCGAQPPSEAHHILQGRHFLCIPLCDSCHRDGFNGWHGQRRIWKVLKKNELTVLHDTIELLSKE